MWNPAKYASHQAQHETYLEVRQYLRRWPWQWMISLSFPLEVTFYRARRIFDRWRLQLIAHIEDVDNLSG